MTEIEREKTKNNPEQVGSETREGSVKIPSTLVH
jgi:hypothetical protein